MGMIEDEKQEEEEVDEIINNSIRQSIYSMASHNEEEDTVNILSHSQNNFCDNVLNNLLPQIDASPSKCLEILRSIDIQNADCFNYFNRKSNAKDEIIVPIIHDLIENAIRIYVRNRKIK